MKGQRKLMALLSAALVCQSMPGFAVIVKANDAVHAQQDEQDSYRAIRSYWRNELIGDITGMESDRELLASIQKLDDKAIGYVNTMQDPLTSDHLWIDEAYMGAELGAKATETLDRLKMIAIQTLQPSSSLYQNEEIMQKVTAGLRFVLDKKYGPTTAKGSSNWWDWEIGAPKSLVDLAILYEDRLEDATIQDVTKTIDRFIPYANRRGTASTGMLETGANLCDKVAIMIKRASLDNNEERLAHAKNCMSPLFSYSNSGDGYYPDGSFIQHGNIPYNGSYGYVVLNELTNCIIMLNLTDYAIDQEDIAFYENTLLNHYVPFLSYGGNMVDSVRGRAVSRKSQQGDTMGMQTMGVLLQYASIASAEVQEKLTTSMKGLVEEKFAQEQSEDFSVLAYADYIRVKGMLQQEAMQDAKQDRFSIYSIMDRFVADREDYTFTMAGNSSRMCTEYGNQENLLGRYQGQGYTQLYNDDINQYNEDYNATVDQKRLTGVTSAHQDLGFNTSGQSKWSGGSSLDGINGASGLELTGNKLLTTLSGGFGSEDSTGIKSGITAKKSYFVFGDKIVYLGAGITNTESDAGVDFVETIVENRKAFDGMQLRVDGKQVVSTDGSSTLRNPGYAYLSGKSEQSGIGYVFLEDMQLDVKRETRDGSWNDVNKLAKFTDTTPVSNRFVSMAVDHGTTPSDETYSWVTMPNASLAEVTEFKANPTIKVLENSKLVQAVADDATKQEAYNFFAAGTSGNVGVSAPCSMVIKQTLDGYELAVSDPTRSINSVDITLQGFTSLKHIGITQGSAELISSSDNAMTIRVSFDSRDGQSEQVKIGATFQTQSENLALNKQATASSVVQNKATAQRLPKFAVDGKLDSRWASNYERTDQPISKEEADLGWFQVDLGTVQKVNQVKVSWEASVSNDYDIMVAGEDQVFRSVASHKDTTSTKLPGTPARLDDIVFEEVEARYIKLQSKADSRPLIGGSPLGGLSIWEFEVFNAVDLTRSVAQAEQLLKDYPEEAAFATPSQYMLLKGNLEKALTDAKLLIANGASYQESELKRIASALHHAVSEFDRAVLHVMDITIAGEREVSLHKAQSYQATAILNPENAYNRKVTWSSKDKAVASVDKDGKITGLASGETIITATSEDGAKSDRIKVIVDVRPEKITLDQTALTMSKGDTSALHAALSPIDATNQKLLWSSDQERVVTVDDAGVVTAVGVGKATIMVKSEADPSVQATCTIEVKANLKVPGVNLALQEGTKATASSVVNAAGVTPQAAIDGNMSTRWASDYKNNTVEEAERQWLLIELPAVTKLNHMDITWFSETTYGKEYQILTSIDGITYEEAYRETNGKNKTYGFDFDPVEAKFVKFQGNKRTNTSGGYGICELAFSYQLSYDDIVGKANALLTLYPVEFSKQEIAYQALKDSVTAVDQMMEQTPDFTSDQLREKLIAVEKASAAYQALIIPVTGLQDSAVNMKEHTQQQITLQLTPANATNQTAIYQSSDPTVVSISEAGLMDAHREGIATIHVTTVDGAYEADVVVTVSSNRIPSIHASDLTLQVGDSFDPLDYVSAIDHEDGEITLTAQHIKRNTVDTSAPGIYEVTYEVSDQDGNTVEKTIKVTVQAKEDTTAIRQQLKTTIEQAERYEEADYTADSYAQLVQALANAKAMAANEKASGLQLEEAYSILQTAMEELVETEQDVVTPEEIRQQLKAAMELAESFVEADYTVDSYAQLTQALANAKAVYADEQAAPLQLKEAKASLQAAMEQLVKASAGEETPPEENHPTPPIQEQEPDSKPSPDTGDTTNDGLLATLFLGSLAAGAVAIKKRLKR